VAFKAKTSNDDDSKTSTNDDVALMVKKFKRFMKKEGYQGDSSKSGKSCSKNPFAKKKCFECGEMGHISTNCKNKMKIILARRKILKARRNCSRSTRRKMARLVMLSGIQMQVRILTWWETLQEGSCWHCHQGSSISFRHISFLMAKGEPKVCEIDEFMYDDLVEMVSNLVDFLGDM
jgi:hypothetical protein